MSDDYDDDIGKLPNFIPPEAQKNADAQAAKGDADWATQAVNNLINEVNRESENLVNITITDTETTTISIPDPVDKSNDDLRGVQRDFPEIIPESVDEIEEDIEEALQEKHIDMSDPRVQQAILDMANKINIQNGVEESEELRHLRELLQKSHQHNQPQGHATGSSVNLIEGVASVVAGGASIVGGAASLVGSGLKAASQAIDAHATRKPNESIAVPDAGRIEPTLGKDFIVSDEVMILPRISEYRVSTIEKAATAYEEAKNQFWESGTLPNVKREIEDRARVTGISVPDVMEKMKPGGEMADLHKKFTEAVAASPDAQSHKKSMDRALESWGRQNSRGQEELLNPETEGLPQYEAMRSRLHKSKERMEQETQGVPVFEGEDKSHAERLREMMERLAEKLKEFAQNIMNSLKGKKSEHGAVAHAEP